MKAFLLLAAFAVLTVSSYAGESISKDDAIAIAKKKYSQTITAPFGVAYSAKPVEGGFLIKIQRILDYNQAENRPVYDIVATHVFVSRSGKIQDE